MTTHSTEPTPAPTNVPPRALCGFAIPLAFGEERPCDQTATGWRWYQDVEHEDALAPACDLHANEGGRRIAAAEADRSRLQETCLPLAASLCMATDGTTSSVVRQIETYVEHLENRVTVAERAATTAVEWTRSHPTTHEARHTEGYWRAQRDLQELLDRPTGATDVRQGA